MRDNQAFLIQVRNGVSLAGYLAYAWEARYPGVCETPLKAQWKWPIKELDDTVTLLQVSRRPGRAIAVVGRRR